MNIFEYASRNKVRYIYRGCLTVEDMWDLSLTDLDNIYKKLNAEKRATEEDSLLDAPTAKNNELSIKIDIVKHIVAEKISEKERRAKVAENKIRKQKLLEIIESKQSEELLNKSIDEIQKMIDDLE